MRRTIHTNSLLWNKIKKSQDILFFLVSCNKKLKAMHMYFNVQEAVLKTRLQYVTGPYACVSNAF